MLEQNYPNPFNPSTTISYTVPKTADVRINIFDVLGRRVALLVDDVVSAGTHTVTFRADHLASGVYFYVLHAADAHLVRKMVFVK